MILKHFFVLQLKRKCSLAAAFHAPAWPDTPLFVMSEPDDVEEQRPDQAAASVSSPSTTPATAHSTTTKKQKQNKEDDILDLMQQQYQRSKRLQEVVQERLQRGHDDDRTVWGHRQHALRHVHVRDHAAYLAETKRRLWDQADATATAAYSSTSGRISTVPANGAAAAYSSSTRRLLQAVVLSCTSHHRSSRHRCRHQC